MNDDEMRDPLDEAPEPAEVAEDPAQPQLEDAPPEEAPEAEELLSAAGFMPDARELLLEADEMAAETAAEAGPPLPADDEGDSAALEPVPELEAQPELEAGSGEIDELPGTPMSYDLPQALFDAGIDVDAALGALSFELSSGSYDEDRGASRLPSFTPSNYRPALHMPSSIRLHRGHIGSVVPALVLIGVGAWLTLANASGVPADPALAGLILVGGLMASFIAEWLFSGRWARGLLLVALVALFGAGGAALVLQSGADNARAAWPLLLAALGVAVILSGLLARPVERAALGPGMVFITAGITGFLALNGVIPASVLPVAAAYWFVPAVIVLLLLLLPVIFRKSS